MGSSLTKKGKNTIINDKDCDITFDDIFDNPYYLTCFVEWCKLHYCEKNIFFVLDVWKYNEILAHGTIEKATEKGEKICHKYIEKNAPIQITLSNKLRETIFA